MTRHPDFFLVGAPKCGTTAMHAYLKLHPRIFMPQAKEIHYYGSDLSRLASQLSAERHAALFAEAKADQIAGETCIWALYSRRAAEEIRRELPRAKILVMLRNPVDMVYAQHSEFVYQWVEDIVDFRRALAAEEDRKRGKRLPNSVYSVPPEVLFYRETAKYAVQVERYLDAFGARNVHVIIYDDLRRDSHGVYRAVLEFLEVDPRRHIEMPVINPNKRVRSVRLRKLMNRPSPALRRLCETMIPWEAVRRRWFERLDAWNVGYRPRPPMSGNTRRRLQAEFAADVERLGRLLGRDLMHWVDRPSSARNENANGPSNVERRAA
ncbi:MAG: sulfotransferase [Pirellulales bacterium]|nr:sulfotransferase [Pirellulales bacterium]